MDETQSPEEIVGDVTERDDPPTGPAPMANPRTMSAPRRLLARVRSVMAAPGTSQDRLDQIVRIIANEMVAEVCSIYVRRAGDLLELFATEGLKAEAVHQSRLRVGEGLVGEIAALARPFALADAQHHPSFAYLPETGEERYQSLMGVPVLRASRVTGVVVVQNRTQRQYNDEEVETLQTVAMVLAELIAAEDLISPAELLPTDGIGVRPLRLDGLKLNAGIGMGEALLHVPHIQVTAIVADSPEVERLRLAEAFAEMHGALDDLLSSDAVKESGEHRDVLETYRMIAQDAGWLKRIEDAIDSGLTAEAAVQRVQNQLRARMAQVDDPYLRERVYDLDDVGHRLLQHLMGVDAAPRKVPENAILIARTMGPAQLLDYDQEKLRGLVLEEGSPNAHVAIVARALDIPVLGRVGGVLDRIDDGETVVVDADHGQVFLRPGDDIVDTVTDNIAARASQKQSYAQLRDLPAISRDGVEVSLNINAGLRIDLNHLDETNADGIGLFRTEIPFMVESAPPTAERQMEIYQSVFERAAGRPVVFRTLDAGGDKKLPYWQTAEEENPSMGWRAIRVSLDRPAMLRRQLRALLNAAGGHELRVMFPMIAEVAEFDRAHDLVVNEVARAAQDGVEPPKAVKVGAMLEVPSLAFQLPSLLERVDFLSIGSNDMLQFLFASDRGNPIMSGRYDELSPPVLNFLRTVVEAANDANVELSLCGEMAGRPLDALVLIGLGFRRLSMAASSIGAVKAMIRSSTVAEIAAYLYDLRGQSGHSLRPQVRGFARDHGVVI